MEGPRRGEEKEQAIGRRFQEETAYTADTLGGYGLDWEHMPEAYKDYPDPLACVKLPEPKLDDTANLWEIFYLRRSVRDYAADRPLPLDLLSSLFWAIQGITAKEGDYYFRAAPSAGGLYPVETYLLARDVESLDPGIYHFRPHMFDLELLQRGNLARRLAQAALGQELILDAQATFIWTAVLARGKWKYRERAYRYVYLDAGHIGQNLYLAGTALGLGVCAVGAFFDGQVNGLLGVDGVEETALYMAAAGWRR